MPETPPPTPCPSPEADDPAPLPPTMPDLDDCCGQGCEPCIFDLYEQARERHRLALQAWQDRRAAGGGGEAR